MRHNAFKSAQSPNSEKTASVTTNIFRSLWLCKISSSCTVSLCEKVFTSHPHSPTASHNVGLFCSSISTKESGSRIAESAALCTTPPLAKSCVRDLPSLFAIVLSRLRVALEQPEKKGEPLVPAPPWERLSIPTLITSECLAILTIAERQRCSFI